MLKAAKIESNRSKFPDSSTQNIDQENLLVEFIRENNSNKNDNCTNSCQNISNQLMFERMILNHFHINASNYCFQARGPSSFAHRVTSEVAHVSFLPEVVAQI